MLKHISRFFCSYFLFIAFAHGATEPKILELQSQLAELSQKRESIHETYYDMLQDNAITMKKKEQTLANRTLGAASMGAMGIGGMMTASAMAEKNVYADVEADMTAYLATFTCDYGTGKRFKGGEKNLQIPGTNELIPLYSEYVNLANDLKSRKQQLGMRAGIESEKILDSATTGLYDDVSTGITSGAYASLSRALTNPDGEDTKKWQESKDDIIQKLKTGTITTGVGALVGVAGNIIVNKDAPQERSNEIKNEYESSLANLESQINNTQSELNVAIAANTELVDEYNNLLQQHLDFVATMNHKDCKSEQAEYVNAISVLSPITDNTTDMSGIKIPYDLSEQQKIYRLCEKRYETLAIAMTDIETQTDADLAETDMDILFDDVVIPLDEDEINIAPIPLNPNGISQRR